MNSYSRFFISAQRAYAQISANQAAQEFMYGLCRAVGNAVGLYAGNLLLSQFTQWLGMADQQEQSAENCNRPG